MFKEFGLVAFDRCMDLFNHPHGQHPPWSSLLPSGPSRLQATASLLPVTADSWVLSGSQGAWNHTARTLFLSSFPQCN